MAINTLECAKVFQSTLDQVVAETATSGWMEANAGQVLYNGGNEIKIPKIALSGYGDYDRDNGFPQGAVTLSYETMQLTQDRGRKFQLDAMDVDETNFVLAASTVMGEFTRQMAVPEIDAYRYSKLVRGAMAKQKATYGYTPTAETIMQKLLEDITAIEDIAGEQQPMVITMSSPCAAILSQTAEYTRMVQSDAFVAGNYSQKLRFIDSIPIVRVPSARMFSAYSFLSGGADESAGGFEKAQGALACNWIVCAQNAPIAVNKHDVMRIFAPEVNQHADAWLMQCRHYHDLFVMDNAWDVVRVNIADAQPAQG